ncbi:MAG: hypothetical protein JNM68_01460, partial [Dinghuibacter sp.]|nr:hypothetical protein [Dinghuibacter sp.]
TIGEAQPVQAGTGLNTVRFTITDACKAYYIKHGIWLDGCYFWQELRLPLPVSPITNQFRFQEKNKEPRSAFCYGEDVYLDASASTGEGAYLVEITRRPINTRGAFSPFARIGWVNGNLDNPLNLSQALATQTPAVYFEPGFEYSVTLTLSSGPNCNNRVVRTDNFKLNCCSETVNASFLTAVKEDGNGGYRLTAIQLNGFTGLYTGARHFWGIGEAATANGPYQPLAQGTQQGFTYTGARNGMYYQIVHQVYTPCGHYCFAQQVYIQNGAPVITDTDCRLLNILTGICDIPANPRTNCRNATLNWDALPYATEYQVEVTPNAPGCCRNASATPASSIYTTRTNSLPFSAIRNSRNGCFSWRVLAVCSNGQSRWSAPVCANCNPTILTPREVKPVRVTGGGR